VCQEGACARSGLAPNSTTCVPQVLGNIFGTKNTSEMETKATLDHLSQITQVANCRGARLPQPVE